MFTNEQALALAREAHDALRRIAETACTRPEGADHFDWSSEALDELARCAAAVSAATAALAGDPEEEVHASSRDLVTMIVRRRNATLRDRLQGRSHGGVDPPAPEAALRRPPRRSVPGGRAAG